MCCLLMLLLEYRYGVVIAVIAAVLSKFHGNLTNSPWQVIITAVFSFLTTCIQHILLCLGTESPLSLSLSLFVHFMLAIMKIHKIPNKTITTRPTEKDPCGTYFIQSYEFIIFFTFLHTRFGSQNFITYFWF